MSDRHAKTSQPIHPLLAQRHSTRAFDPDGEIGADQLTALLEAARWSPSAGNTQPWRFVVARRDTASFKLVLDALSPGNQGWAKNAALLVVAVQTSENDRGPLSHSAYDLGQSMAHLTMQALSEGLTMRQMGGFDPERISADFDLPEQLVPTAVAAIGVAGDPADLPETLRRPDDTPRQRLPLDELVINKD